MIRHFRPFKRKRQERIQRTFCINFNLPFPFPPLTRYQCSIFIGIASAHFMPSILALKQGCNCENFWLVFKHLLSTQCFHLLLPCFLHFLPLSFNYQIFYLRGDFPKATSSLEQKKISGKNGIVVLDNGKVEIIQVGEIFLNKFLMKKLNEDTTII